MAKNYKLLEEANKDIVYGALLGLIKNPDFWYRSSVNVEYCKLTDQGQEVIQELVEQMMRTIDQVDRGAVDQRAREIVWEELKKD